MELTSHGGKALLESTPEFGNDHRPASKMRKQSFLCLEGY